MSAHDDDSEPSGRVSTKRLWEELRNGSIRQAERLEALTDSINDSTAKTQETLQSMQAILATLTTYIRQSSPAQSTNDQPAQPVAPPEESLSNPRREMPSQDARNYAAPIDARRSTPISVHSTRTTPEIPISRQTSPTYDFATTADRDLAYRRQTSTETDDTAKREASSHLPNVKALPSFSGKHGEDVNDWIEQIERHFFLYKVEEQFKTPLAVTRLKHGAHQFYRAAKTKNDGKELPWERFIRGLKDEYGSLKNIGFAIRQQMDSLQYKGPDSMLDYVDNFRELSQQVYDMAYADRLDRFLKKLPLACDTHCRDFARSDNTDMEIIYSHAKNWASNQIASSKNHRSRDADSYAPRLHRRHRKSKSKHRSKSASVPSEDEIDLMPASEGRCHRCNKPGHFIKDCRVKLPSDSNATYGRSTSKPSYGRSKRYSKAPAHRNKFYIAEELEDHTHSPSESESGTGSDFSETEESDDPLKG